MLRIVFSQLRGAADGIQLAELSLYSSRGRPVEGVTAENPGGLALTPFQRSHAVVDGLLSTKWFDGAMGRANRSVLLLRRERAAQNGSEETTPCLPAASCSLGDDVVEYEFFTANDNPRRDPCSWLVERQTAGGAWELLSEVHAFSPPLARKASFGRSPLSSSAPTSPPHACPSSAGRHTPSNIGEARRVGVADAGRVSSRVGERGYAQVEPNQSAGVRASGAIGARGTNLVPPGALVQRCPPATPHDDSFEGCYSW
ncbi:hypothetical protein AB1Y20_005828 [Prymnesium parvum]|uniref:Phospholipase B-like n=1 Tax=Prymnesium parvum TaxID=97485 RepID=A0AB34IZZ1_PRYPA